METDQQQAGKFLDPVTIISQTDMTVGSYVADFGCGPGFFSIPLAKAIGNGGIVFALDVLPQALETVESKAKTEGVANIRTKRVNLEKVNGSHIEDAFLDWVIMKDVLFQNQKKQVMIGEAHRVLKQGGKVLVVEWKKEQDMLGPDLSLRVDEDELKEIFRQTGFEQEKEVDAGSHHYAWIFRKK